jgi:wyosine [tRNA(Phe)-imidazoG37] synthetase (radical SAM superfamily)
MNTIVETPSGSRPAELLPKIVTEFGRPRDFLGHRFVYVVISPRARGLSIGVNISPDKQCNFDCVYCEVDRRASSADGHLDLDVLSAELETTLAFVRGGKLREHPAYSLLPPELQRLRHVAISGDGEPTLSPQFREAVEAVVHVRAKCGGAFFKIVLITNSSNLDSPLVHEGLRLLTAQDEIWAKLDAGTRSHVQRVNKTEAPLDRILSNILLMARRRPVIIQSLFPAVNGIGPSDEEINQYVQRLKELKDAGAQIPLVQIYSATRPMANPGCGHLPLKILSQIAQAVRRTAGLNAEVF